MASFRDGIPGYLEAVARETVGRDAAYLRLPRLVAGFALRPLTLRDYLRLSAENSPFVAGGRPGRDDIAFLLWHQRTERRADVDEQAFAAGLDQVDLAFLVASCRAYIAEAMADAPGSGGKQRSYWGLGASAVATLRHEYPGCTHEEVLDKPVDEIWQEFKAIQKRVDPRAIQFNRSDKIVGDWLARRGDGKTAPAAEPPPAPVSRKRKANR